jgi:hypothetical protein
MSRTHKNFFQLILQILFEVRELKESSSKIIESKDIIYIKRDGMHMEFTLVSRGIDEDRKCYMYYGNFIGESR